MKRKVMMYFLCFMTASVLFTGCGRRTESDSKEMGSTYLMENASDYENGENEIRIVPSEEIQRLENGLSVGRYEGDYGFMDFLAQGGAKSDAAVAEYLTESISHGAFEMLFGGNPFGCSTLSAKGKEGGYLFGRNFDWNDCEAMIVSAKPKEGYASVSTVNMNFVSASGIDLSKLPDSVRMIIALYAPLDGMNEMGLAVSVNMIQDSEKTEQNTEKPDITTTTAIRLLLDQASNVEEAIKLLEAYDMHASMGMAVHFALADADGNSVVVEYLGNEMYVTETPVVTNFYLTEGEKYGIGTSQSHERYDSLMKLLETQEEMTVTEVRDALDSVSKDNFGEFESTEWSIVMDQKTKELTYYHRENYEIGYVISVMHSESAL